MLAVVWSKTTRPLFFRIIIYGTLFQFFLMAYFYSGSKKVEEKPIFENKDATHNYMNVCSLPVYDYWHPEIMAHVDNDFDPMSSCDQSFTPYTTLINGKWDIIEEKKGMNCSARCFEGKEDRTLLKGNWTQPGPTDCEFLEAVCWEREREVYGYLHTQINPKPAPETKFKDPPSVFVFLLDSASMGQMKRALSGTVATMMRRLEAVEFPFINKVGENSQPNGLSLWFGKTIEGSNDEMYGGKNISSEWPHEEYCLQPLPNTSILHDYKEYGYITLNVDDWASQMVLYPNCKGFPQAPTDHYMHPFQMMHEYFGTNITKKHLMGQFCREQHHAVLEYFQQFVDAYKDRPKFTWIWLNEIMHDCFNGLFRIDQPMQQLLEKNIEVFENSFVILMGDHGFRMASEKFFESEIARFEVNNPYFSISIPKKLRRNSTILETLRENSKKLQTHFDTRATLLDILKFQPESDFSDRSILEIPGEKGHSYLRKQPELPRTCGTLPIPHQYCICQVEKIDEIDENLKNRMGNRLIDHIHEMLEKGNFSSMCERFVLREVPLLQHFGHTYQTHSTHNYEIIAMAEAPSFAKFHTFIVHNLTTDEIQFERIERFDSYGDTGDCTQHRDFEKICFCKNLSTWDRLMHRMNKQLREWAYWLENALPTVLTQ